MIGMTVGIVAVCDSIVDRQRLNIVKRAWTKARRQNWVPDGVTLDSDIYVEIDLGAAVDRVSHDPQRKILLTSGYPREVVQQHLAMGATDLQVIAYTPRDKKSRLRVPSASLYAGSRRFPSVIFGGDPYMTLKKAVIRHLACQNIQIRVLSKEDLHAYFSLRYSVWDELDYIDADRRCAEVQYEVDFTDRSSIPIGAFAVGPDLTAPRLVGCGRLVHEAGNSEPKFEKMIQEFVTRSGSVRLQENLDYPLGIGHPFDILESFPGFWDYYADLTQARQAKAEISRIIVEPEARGRGIGEVIVDSLVDLACEHHVDVLFLACLGKHEPFYKQCGFERIPDLYCDSFVNVSAPAIAMQRSLRSQRSGRDR